MDNASSYMACMSSTDNSMRYVDAMAAPEPVKHGLGEKASEPGKFVSLEVLRAALREGIGLFF
jgi:hypothetical protein